MSEKEEILSGGNVNSSVVRVGMTVRRRTTPASLAVHRLLLHLEGKRFSGSPRFLGLDEQGREILSFLEGETGILPSIWQSDEPLIAAATLLKEYHDATLDFVPPDSAQWAYSHPDPDQHEVICHNDFAPYNFVYAAGLPYAVIDFDLAGPGPRLRDVAYAAYWMVPLSFNSADQKNFTRTDAKNGSPRLRLFCKAYGIPVEQSLFDRIAEVLAFMGDERQMRQIVGEAAAARLKEDGHLAHWQREASSFEHHRSWLEDNLLRQNEPDSGLVRPNGRMAAFAQLPA